MRALHVWMQFESTYVIDVESKDFNSLKLISIHKSSYLEYSYECYMKCIIPRDSKMFPSMIYVRNFLLTMKKMTQPSLNFRD